MWRRSSTRPVILRQVRQTNCRTGDRIAASSRSSAGTLASAGHPLAAISAFNTIGGAILYIVANTLLAHLHEMGAPPQAPTGFLRPLLSVVAIFILAKAACGFIAGWGLLQREPWARVIALVLGFISLFNIPFGTAVGVYTLWVLLPAQSRQEYDSLATSRAA